MQFYLPFLNTSFGLSQPDHASKRMFLTWWPSGTAYFFPIFDSEPTIYRSYSQLSTKEFSGGLRDWEVSLIAGDEFERIDIYNISETGFVVGPGDRSPFLDWSVAGLLDAWLNVSFDVLQPTGMRDFIELDIPLADHSNPSTITYMPSRIMLKNRWKSSEGSPRYVIFGVLPDEANALNCMSFGVGITSPNTRGVHFNWPKPLTGFFPFGSTADDYREQQKMVSVARKSSIDPNEALYEARNESKLYLSDGYTTREAAWFWPTVLDPNSGEEGIRCIATNFGLPSTRTLEELRGIKQFDEWLEEKIPIRRVWGTLGLFWALLLEHLQAHQTFHGCKRCDRTIRGNTTKQYCSAEDNPECYRERRANDRRRERKG